MSGRFHAGIDKYMNAKLTTDQKEFERIIEKDEFVDFKPLSRSANLVVLDGKMILCRNPIYIPSAVYTGWGKLKTF